MELRHLRYFRTVAEERHITRAAERLSIQQPPLSLQIKALETELGVQLFHRRPRGVELTKAGEAFYAEVCAILAGLEGAVSKTQRVARGEAGSIAIGFTSSVMFHAATKTAIRTYRAAFPEVAVALEEEGSTELIDSIARNRLDAAFVRTNATLVPGIRFYRMLEEPIFLAIPPGHALAGEPLRPVKLKDLSDQPLVLYRRASGPGLYDRIIAACNRLGFVPQVVQEAPRVGSALNLVAAGLGISFAPQSLCGSHTEGVLYRPIDCNPPLVAPITLACRKSEASEAVKSFVRIARAAMKAWGRSAAV